MNVYCHRIDQSHTQLMFLMSFDELATSLGSIV